MKKLVAISILAVMVAMVIAAPAMAFTGSSCPITQAIQNQPAQTQLNTGCTAPATQGKAQAGQISMPDFKAFFGQFKNIAPANGAQCPR